MPSFKNSGVYTIQSQGQAITSGQWATDPYYKYTTVLLQGDGMPNSSQNNTFLDSSTNSFAITRNGNTTQGSFTPYGPTWSNYFDGTGDYLTNTSNALITQAVSTFTAEAWVFMTANPTSDANYLGSMVSLDGEAANTTNYLSFGPISTRKLRLRWFDGASKYAEGATTLALNTWYHIAVVVTSNSIAMYVNGVAETLSGTTTLTARSGTSSDFSVGANYYSTFWGYISNLRVTTSAVYSSSFTPTTAPLTTTSQGASGCVLLTCQSNRFVDNSVNAYALTVGGTPSVQRFSPFAPQYQYTPAVIGGSGYFDGSGDYLTVPNNTALQILGGSFTLDCWIYLTAAQANMGIIGIHDNSTAGYFIRLDTSIIRFYTSAATVDRTYAFAQNTWYHIAVVSSGTTGTLYINGVAQGATFSTNGTQDTTDQFIIGKTTTLTNYFTGYISDVRVIKGSAVVPPVGGPTAPLTAVTNTTLLCNFTNAGIYDNAMMNNLETVGNAQVSTSVVKYGSGSMYFDGSGDYLKFPQTSTPQLTMGSADWTIECWVYPLTSSQAILIAGQGDNATAAGSSYGLFVNTATTSDLYYNGASGLGTTTPYAAVGQWTHIAWVRNGTSVKMYTNGVQTGSGTLSAGAVVNTGATTYPAAIGAGSVGSNYFNGYIDDFRFTKGVARYTGNFIPPKVAFATQ